MDLLDYFIELLPRWRLWLAFGASVALALVLSRAFEPFTAGYCVALVIVGTVLGMIWEVREPAMRARGE